MQQPAFVQAKRELEVFLNRRLTDPTTNDIYRDDYGHFEQTLYILENVPHKGGAGDAGAIRTAQKKAGSIIDDQGVKVAPRAQVYLALNRRRIVRG